VVEVRVLIAAGVEPDTADYDGRTAPPHLRAAEGQLVVVRYLLACGTEPAPPTGQVARRGPTPRRTAASRSSSCCARSRLLGR
jgi:glutaminase